jgi:RHS repeat-associated protein
MKKLILLSGLFILFPLFLFAQTGLPPFGSFSGSSFDTVNNSNLNAVFSIPIVSSPGRGLPLSLNLNYNTLIWQNSGTTWTPVTDSSGNPTWGWRKDFPAGGSVSYWTYTGQIKCYPGGQIYPKTFYRDYVYVDAFGTRHNFPVNYYQSDCPAGNGGTYPPAYASDSSGYLLSQAGDNPIVLGPNGQQETGGTFTSTDANGNYVTKTTVTCSGCVETDWTDSVGHTALKVIYTPNTTSPTSIQYKFLDGSGNYQSITLQFLSKSIKTNFGCTVGEYTGTANLPSELDIPSPVSGTIKYTFSYEPTPNNSGYVTGRLQKVTLPTGGSYEWDYTGNNDGINCADGTTLSMNRVVSDGTNSATWNFVRNTTNLTTTVTTPGLPDIPNAFDTVYSMGSGASSGHEFSHKVYKESPGVNILRTINTVWASNGTPSSSTTILEDNTTKAETDTVYDSNGLLGSVTEYDWGSGTHGSASPIRTTTFSYQTSANYTSRNLINLVTSKIVKDGSGTVQYRQDTTYDGVALTCPTGAAQHDDTGHPCTSNYRGNPTAITTYTSPGVPSGGITKNFTYDWFGNLRTAQLNCCTSKTWTYSATTQYSQPDSATSGTSPTQLTTSYLYNLYLGLATKSTDPNNLVTNYTYDFLRRPLTVSQVNGAVNGQSVTYSYNDTTFVTTVTTTIDSSRSVQQIAAVDGLGRVLTSTTEDINSNIISKVSAKYDLLSRAYQTSNPYQTGSPSLWTTTAFDVLGRPTSVSLPDSSATSYAYSAQTATVTDPASKKRKSQMDAAGRLVAVTEPDSSNALNKVTLYTYTVLDALASATDDAGTQTRTYTYDNLGRLVSTITPEGGQTCFGTRTGSSCNQDGYDSFDNLLTRTDARGVVTSYTYDGLNRLKGVSYNVVTGVPSTASVSFTYGTSASQFNNGALITMTDGAGSENYSYNALEQLTQLQKVINGTTFTTNYLYNIAGELTQIQYPSLRVVQQSVDAIGRLCEIAPSTTGCGTAASPYATGYGYNVASQVTGFKYGNGIYASLGFSSDRLQLNCLDYSTANRNGNCTHDSTTKFGLTYYYKTDPTYCTNGTSANNGQVQCITDSADNGRSVAYSYDPLSRLSTALTTGSANYAQWGLSWGYDRYGNRLNQTLTAGSGYQGTVQVTASSNRINCIGGSGQSCTGGVIPAYDSNGNMTYDGTNTLVYDAENHATSATNQSSAGTYTYDGNGLRVQKCVPNCTSPTTKTVYVFSGSKVIAEYDNGAVPTAPSREYVYGGGALLAKIDSSGTKYYHQDHVSNRVVTNSTGAVIEQIGNYPFGDPWYNASNDKLVFTTYERDAESGNDYAIARYYRWLLGRFLSLDPLSGSTFDPQSLNRYTYALNDPVNNSDPSGACITPDASTWDHVIQGFVCPPNTDGDYQSHGGDYFDYQFVIVDNANNFFTGGTGSSGIITSDTTASDGTHVTGLIIDQVSASPIDFIYQGTVDLIGAGGGSPGDDIKPWQMRKAVVNLLRAKNPCSDWFNQGTGSAANMMSNVPILLYNPTVVSMNMPDGGTGSPGSPINVNRLGRFYTDRYNPGLVGDSFKAGSPGARFTILLHELAHQVMPPGFVSNDGDTPGGPEKNTQLLLKHCLHDILNASDDILQKGLP